MKKVMMTIAVVVVLMGISDKAWAGPWTRFAFGPSRRCGGYGYRYDRYGYRPVLGRSPWTNWAFGRSSYARYGGYGGYGYYGRDRTLTRVMSYVGSGMNVLDTLDRRSINNRVVNSQISASNRMLSMDEREQEFRHQQIRTQARTPRKKVLVGTDPAIYVLVPVDRQVKTKPEKTQEKKQQQDFLKIVSELKDENWKERTEFLLKHSEKRYTGEEFDLIVTKAKSKGISLEKASEELKDYIQWKRNQSSQQSKQ